MARKSSIAWQKIKHEYITNDVSFKDLAKKYNVSLRSIAGKASEEGWTKQKEKYCIEVASKVHQKSVEKTSESLAEYCTEMKQDLIELHRMLADKSRETLSLLDIAFSPRDLQSVSSMLVNIASNMEKFIAQENVGGTAKDQITIEFVNNDWDGGDAGANA